MTPLERYQADLQRPDFFHDAAQANAVKHLQRLYDDLVAADHAKPGLFGKLLGRKSGGPVKGLYFWGGVGRGKTYLVDTFFESLPFEQKVRTHFHRFMKRVHEELKTLKGEKNPLTIIGKRFADEARVICFDEFFVSDITDAMILATLLEELFKNGVSLVATSNIVPDGLYKDGLQRARFLPAIALLKEHTEIVNVDSGVDYRLRALEQAELFHWPLSEQVEEEMARSFKALTPDCAKAQRDEALMIENREIRARLTCDDVAWFEFRELCDGPRSQNDYIELAKIFHAVLISNVEQMGVTKDDMARRFINLVDEFYDRSVKLIISAEVELKRSLQRRPAGVRIPAHPQSSAGNAVPRIPDASAPALIRGGTRKGLPMATLFSWALGVSALRGVLLEAGEELLRVGHFEGFHGVDRLDRHGLLQLSDGLLPLVVAVYVGERVGVLVVADRQVVGLAEGAGEVLFHLVGADPVGHLADQLADLADHSRLVAAVERQGERLVGLPGQEGVQFLGDFAGIAALEHYRYR